jgi:hypothetical protein
MGKEREKPKTTSSPLRIFFGLITNFFFEIDSDPDPNTNMGLKFGPFQVFLLCNINIQTHSICNGREFHFNNSCDSLEEKCHSRSLNHLLISIYFFSWWLWGFGGGRSCWRGSTWGVRWVNVVRLHTLASAPICTCGSCSEKIAIVTATGPP